MSETSAAAPRSATRRDRIPKPSCVHSERRTKVLRVRSPDDVPYQFHLRSGIGDHGFDRLVELGAIDVEWAPDGRLAALMPDGISPERVAEALGVDQVSVSPATGRDAGSTWTLSPRATRVGRLQIVPVDSESE